MHSAQMCLCGEWMKSRSALVVPARAHNNTSVLTSDRGEERMREEGWSLFSCSFIAFRPVSYFVARAVNPSLPVGLVLLHKTCTRRFAE